MTRAEFEAWGEFYRMHPYDDYHRFYRPAALLASVSTGAKVDELLAWLEPKPKVEGYSDADMATMRALGITPRPREKK